MHSALQLSAIATVVLSALAACLVSCRNGTTPGTFETVLRINNEPVAAGEFLHYLQAQRSCVHTYFKMKYGVEDNASFWTTACNGEVPIDMARRQALEACTRDKVQQIEAKKLNMYRRIDYRSLIAGMEDYNRERASSVKKGAVLYGPVTLDEKCYVDLVMGELRRDLRKKLTGDMPSDRADSVYTGMVDRRVRDANVAAIEKNMARLKL